MKFLCDEMLKGMARWLRAAGYDVRIEPDGTDDTTLLRRARAEQRILLTRDKRLLKERPPVEEVLLLHCNSRQACFEELSKKLGVAWLYRPFSRCLRCNTPLLEAGDDRWKEVPEFSRDSATQLRFCPSCNQLFWDGSHVARMLATLQQADASYAQYMRPMNERGL